MYISGFGSYLASRCTKCQEEPHAAGTTSRLLLLLVNPMVDTMLPCIPENYGSREGDDTFDPSTECDKREELAGVIVLLRGVIFWKSVRSQYACLHIARQNEEDGEEDPVMVKISFQEYLTEFRSFFRRFCKVGDELSILSNSRGSGFEWSETSEESDWVVPTRLSFEVESLQEASDRMVIVRKRAWRFRRIDEWQTQYLNIRQKEMVRPVNPISERKRNHANGLGKREQAESLVKFACEKLGKKYLNQKSGVLDVAGGSGHVSMTLGMNGIKSTIVDPRENVGRLPGRDRKIWNRAMKGLTTCQPVQFESYRAWFGIPPDVRYDEQKSLPVCDEQDAMLAQCSAILALHPDEATDAVVDLAVKQQIPFFIVPCCVFFRLFHHRRMPGSSQPVSTYNELLDYLQAKHISIKRVELPFEGANILLWSSFKAEDD